MKTLKISSLFLLLAALFFSCQKEYSLEGIVTPAGTWQFNDAATLYTGNIDSAYIETSGTTKTLNLVGRSADGQQNFLMHLYATDSFTVGTYKASLFQSDFQYYTQAKTFYEADQFIGEFIVTISAIGNNNITGIFSGDAEDSTGAIKPLTLGKFTSRINLSTNGTGGGGGGTGTAVGTLGSASGVCTPISTGGTFTQGISLTSANTANVQVTVTTPGTYTISTTTVNGVSFSKTGTFGSVGGQTVILNGTGTPVASGNQTFTVTFGGSTCTFVINFLPGIAPVVGDYYPRTAGSNWSYEFNNDASDTIFRRVLSQTLTRVNTYNIFMETDDLPSGYDSSGYYRKAGGDYFEYFDVGDFFGGTSIQSKWGEYIFLKDNVAAGNTWNTVFNVNVISGSTTVPVDVRVTELIQQKDVTITVKGVPYPNTIVVKETYEFFDGSGWQDAAGYYLIISYSRDIGLIKAEAFDAASNASLGVQQLTRVKIL